MLVDSLTKFETWNLSSLTRRGVSTLVRVPCTSHDLRSEMDPPSGRTRPPKSANGLPAVIVVADGERVVVGDLIGDLGKALVAIEGRREGAGGERRGHDQLGVLIGLLEAADEVHPVLEHRARQDAAILFLLERRPRTRQVILGIELAGTKVVIAAAVKVVGPALRHRADDAAQGVTELGGELARDHLELLDDIDRQAGLRRVAPFDHLVRHAIDDVLDVPAELAVHGEVAALRRLIDAGREERQVEIVAAVERHRLDLLLIDGQAQLRLLGFDHRRLALDRDALLERRHLQREVDRRLAVRREDEAGPFLAGEAGQLDLDAPFTDDRQGEEAVPALVVGGVLTRQAGARRSVASRSRPAERRRTRR